MFFDVFSPLVESSSQAVIYPEWDEREEWIENHNYDPTNVNWCSLDVHNFKRDTGILKYYAFYTVDNIYEYFVFRSHGLLCRIREVRLQNVPADLWDSSRIEAVYHRSFSALTGCFAYGAAVPSGH